MLAGLIEQELLIRAAFVLGDAFGVHRETGRIHLGQTDQPRTAGGRRGDHRLDQLRVAAGSSQTMSCWTAATFICSINPFQPRYRFGEHFGSLAEREPHVMSPSWES